MNNAPKQSNSDGCETCTLNLMNKRPEWFVFFQSYLRSCRAVGTPFSSSHAVAKRMVRGIPMGQMDAGRRFLEVGPGTGVVTELLVEKLGKNDTLDVVEIEDGFYELIREKFHGDSRVHVYHQDIVKFSPNDSEGKPLKYDAIVTGVPLNGLPSVDLLTGILRAYERLAKVGAPISEVEYVGMETLGNLFRGQEFKKVSTTKDAFFKYHNSRSEIEFWNIPLPARINYLTIQPTSFFKK